MTRLTEFHKEDLLEIIKERSGAESKAFYVIDKELFALYPSLFSRLQKQEYLLFESTEKSKNIEQAQILYDRLIGQNFTRSDLLVALGGGICGDLSAFVASTFMRGMRFINVPSSLLAMVDASIGGKTGLNYKNFKNMIGTFYEAEEILCDPTFLESLPEPEFYTGLCEMIKIAAVLDASYFEALENTRTKKIEKSIFPLIRTAQDLKAALVKSDLNDYGKRNALNFGHSIGHALEEIFLARGEQLSHGIAVSIGMAEMMRRSLKHGLCEKSACDRLLSMLEKFGLPGNTEEKTEEIFHYLLHDKKRRGETHRLILCPEIGRFRILELKEDELREFLNL